MDQHADPHDNRMLRDRARPSDRGDRRDRSTFVDVTFVQHVGRIAKWRRATRRGRPVHPSETGFWPLGLKLLASKPPTSSSGSFAAIILVHKRPANLALQVRAALHAPSIGEVIVSCNNPEVRLDDWIGLTSPRLRLLEEAGRNQTRRYRIALDSGAERFVLPDDDVLMSSEALDAFCLSLPANPAYPLGIAGQRCSDDGAWESAVVGAHEEVDVLNRAYVCTREHAAGVFRNAELLGWNEQELYSNPADDLLLSYTGTALPRLVDVDFVNCISHAHRAISTYRQENFNKLRSGWVAEMRAALDRDPARRDLGDRGALRSSPMPASLRIANVVARPLRRRFYMGLNTQALGSLPTPLRNAIGLDDDAATWSRRFQVGMDPVALKGYFRIGDSPGEPDLAACFPFWNLEFKRDYATELVAMRALDTTPPQMVPAVLASWRSMMHSGARLVVGVTDATDVLAERDAQVGQRSWASQLPKPDGPLSSPMQLGNAGLTATLWDRTRIQEAIEAQGFDVVAVLSGQQFTNQPCAGGWTVPFSGGEQELPPLPAVLDGSAQLVAIAKAR